MDHDVDGPSTPGAKRLTRNFKTTAINRFGRFAKYSQSGSLLCGSRLPCTIAVPRNPQLAGLVLPPLNAADSKYNSTGYRRTAPTAFPCASARRPASARHIAHSAKPADSADAGEKSGRVSASGTVTNEPRSAPAPRPEPASSGCGRYVSRNALSKASNPWRGLGAERVHSSSR